LFDVQKQRSVAAGWPRSAGVNYVTAIPPRPCIELRMRALVSDATAVAVPIGAQENSARHDFALVARFDCQSSLPILRQFVWRIPSLAVGSFTETALK